MLELLPTSLDRELASAGLTSFEFTVLEALAEAEHHRLRLSAVAARTNATLARLSRVITALERKGLVERAACEADGRATNAVLTKAGMIAYQESRDLHAQAVRTLILDGLAEDDVDDLARLTYRVLSRLDPEARFTVTEAGRCPSDPEPAACPADPASA